MNDVSERISIVVPAFNERATIAAVLDRLRSIELPVPRESIVIDDGSTDGTRTVLDDVSRRALEVIVIHVAENRGKGHAVRLGFARASGSIIAIQDADLELDPGQLGSLVAPILGRETDVVYGSRFLAARPDAPVMTIAANRLLTWITNLLYGASLTDMETC